jgi:thiosulfate dehydrogenase
MARLSYWKQARPVLLKAIGPLVAALIGLGIGYDQWGRQPDWYAHRDLAALPPGPESDLIRYGWQLVVETPRLIGKNATNPAKRYAGNDLACTNCHMNAGLKPFAAPLVSTFASYPAMFNNMVLSLAERINGCMTRSMNGSPLPTGGREMEAFIAYMQYIARDSPVGVRIAGMGLLPLKPAAQAPDAQRGAAIFTQWCARCHGPNGQGDPRTPPGIGYAIPPLWGPNSFNAAAGMANATMAAAFIRANMPYGVDYRAPILTEQQAWDLAAFITSRPRPGPRPAR